MIRASAQMGEALLNKINTATQTSGLRMHRNEYEEGPHHRLLSVTR